jgi:hypothetical protein
MRSTSRTPDNGNAYKPTVHNAANREPVALKRSAVTVVLSNEVVGLGQNQWDSMHG